MTAVRLLVTGLGLLLLALLVVSPAAGPWFERSWLSVRGWSVLVLTAVGCGLTVAAALVSALHHRRQAPAPQPTVDHYA